MARRYEGQGRPRSLFDEDGTEERTLQERIADATARKDALRARQPEITRGGDARDGNAASSPWMPSSTDVTVNCDDPVRSVATGS